MNKDRFDKAKDVIENMLDFIENVSVLEESDRRLVNDFVEQAERVERLKENAQDLRKALGNRQDQSRRYLELLESIMSNTLRDDVYWKIFDVLVGDPNDN